MNWRLRIFHFPHSFEVMDMDRPPVNDCSASRETTADNAAWGSAHRPVCGYMLKHIAIDQTDLRIGGVTEPCGIFGHGVEYRLDVRRGTRDDAQDFTRRSLLLQRLLEFVEQPDVLNGYHSLVGEGL